VRTFVFETYHAGAFAFFDAFTSGLVPCKVVQVIKPGQGNRVCDGSEIRIQVTEDHKAYRKGEFLTEPAHLVVPRDRLFTRGIYYRINTQYEWAKEEKILDAVS
jgi:hypothetical protein